jgi:GPH family glycoside/pentoside/hexuronide:cation symporter
MPYLQLLTRAVYDPGIMLMWALIPSMIADVCDADELETGCRREASFSSVYQWIWKCGATLAMVSGGFLIAMVGADVDGATDMLPEEVVHRLRLLLSVVPALFGCVALFMIYKFPLSREKVSTIRREIENRR